MSVIDEAVASWKSRLRELERALAPLEKEASDLRAAIAKLEGRATAAAPRRRAGRRRQTPSGRAPRGQNRETILKAIASSAKTAGEVAAETGIARPTVSTTLSKLAKEGAAVKAERGYRAA